MMEKLPSEENIALRKTVFKITETLGSCSSTADIYPFRLKVITAFQLIALPMIIQGFYDAWPDIIKMSYLLVAVFFGIKSSTKGFSRVVKNDEKIFAALNETIDGFYLENEKELEFRKVLVECTRSFRFWIKTFIFLLFLFFNTPTAAALYERYKSDDFVYLVPVHVPFVDPRTTYGFIINQVYLILLPVSFFFTMSFSEIYNLYLTLQIIPMVEIYMQKVKKFVKELDKAKIKKIQPKNSNKIKVSSAPPRQSKTLENSKKPAKEKIQVTTLKIKELIKLYSAYNNYLIQVLEFMEVSSFVTFTVDSFCIGLALVLARFSSIPAGIAIGAMLILQVFAQCAEGTIVSHQNEKLLNEICGLPWYEFSVTQQKIILQFIHACQNTCIYNVPIVGELNMELFTNVVNGAYSFLMFIIQFVKA